MNETVFDKEMKDMLHRCADELHAPDKLKTRVDFALKNGSSKKTAMTAGNTSR